MNSSLCQKLKILLSTTTINPLKPKNKCYLHYDNVEVAKLLILILVLIRAVKVNNTLTQHPLNAVNFFYRAINARY